MKAHLLATGTVRNIPSYRLAANCSMGDMIRQFIKNIFTLFRLCGLSTIWELSQNLRTV